MPRRIHRPVTQPGSANAGLHKPRRDRRRIAHTTAHTPARQPARRPSGTPRLPVRSQVEPTRSLRANELASVLSVPSGLDGIVAARPHVTLLVDIDPMSHAGSPDVSVSDAVLRVDLGRITSTAAQLGLLTQSWFCCSSVTARTHLAVMTEAKNNTWRVGYGINGADRIIEQALTDVLQPPAATTRHRLVVLVAGDGAYSRAVERLRDAGIPTWVIIPPRTGSSRALRSAAAAVSWMDDEAAVSSAA